MDEERAPLAQAIAAHLAKNNASFHTPGHKGHAPFLRDCLAEDLTELPDTGSLYDGGDVIEQAEQLAARAFGAAHTLFSGGGCTLCIQTMLLLGTGAGGCVLMARNSHRSAVHTAALLGLEVVWLWRVTAFDVNIALNNNARIQSVYITSPDYAGQLCDVAGIAAVCDKAGVPLLVDNAHGSHLGAFGWHPLMLGASMSADSAHKTLPVRTGGAYLHIAEKAAVTGREAKAAMALFGSTSPAFPVLASLDLARAWWESEGQEAYRRLAKEVQPLKAHPAALHGGDPARLTLCGDGQGIAAHLRRCGCEPEHADTVQTVCILTPFNTAGERERLRRAVDTLPSQPLLAAQEEQTPPRVICGVREAMFSPVCTVSAAKAVGRVAARTVSVCPPGIPLLVPGEEIGTDVAARLEKCGFSQLVVLKTL